MRRTSMPVLAVSLLLTGGLAQALPVCEAPGDGACVISDEVLASNRWPAVRPLPVDEELLYDRDYRRVEGILPVYEEPFGELLETADEGYSFVTVSQIVDDWAEIGEEQWVPLDVLGEEVIPSRYAGVELPAAGLEFPMAWTLRHLRAATEPGGADSPLNPFLYRYTRVNVFSCVKVNGKCWYQIGADQWVHQYNLAMYHPVARPEAIETQKWVGIDLYEQVLTAYEGDTPVFTTLVSSGLEEWSTNEGIFHVWLRRARGDMSGAFQQPDARRIHIEFPRRKHPDMAPIQHICADALARFKQDRTLAAFDQMRRRRQANGPAADNRHRQVIHCPSPIMN